MCVKPPKGLHGWLPQHPPQSCPCKGLESALCSPFAHASTVPASWPRLSRPTIPCKQNMPAYWPCSADVRCKSACPYWGWKTRCSESTWRTITAAFLLTPVAHPGMLLPNWTLDKAVMLVQCPADHRSVSVQSYQSITGTAYPANDEHTLYLLWERLSLNRGERVCCRRKCLGAYACISHLWPLTPWCGNIGTLLQLLLLPRACNDTVLLQLQWRLLPVDQRPPLSLSRWYRMLQIDPGLCWSDLSSSMCEEAFLKRLCYQLWAQTNHKNEVYGCCMVWLNSTVSASFNNLLWWAQHVWATESDSQAILFILLQLLHVTWHWHMIYTHLWFICALRNRLKSSVCLQD